MGKRPSRRSGRRRPGKRRPGKKRPGKKRPGTGGEGRSGRLARGVRRALHPYVQEAERMARRFVREALDRFGAELGYDLDHVRRLDNLCRTAGAEFDDELTLRAGFYFGEILRRAYDGRYQWHAGRDALALEIGALRTFPIEKVRQVLAAPSPERSLEAYLMVLAKRLADQRFAEPREAEDQW